MSDRDEALALLRERFPEPFSVMRWAYPDRNGVWVALAECGDVEVRCEVRGDAMAAVRAVIAAWDEATKGEVERKGGALLLEMASTINAERAHADRLAVGLRTVLVDGWPWLTADPLTIDAVAALAAHDALRKGEAQ